MICVNKSTFEIAEDVVDDDFNIHPDWFECDDMIAETIALLNKKGYKTEFCCQGHMSTHAFDYVNNEFFNRLLVSAPYIVFDKEYQFQTIPDGWTLVKHIEEGPFLDEETGKEVLDNRISIYQNKIANKYEIMNSYCTGITLDFQEELVQVMKDLLSWSLSLPYNK